VKYAVLTPATPPRDPAKVRKAPFDMVSALTLGVVVRNRLCTRWTEAVTLDRIAESANRRVAQY